MTDALIVQLPAHSVEPGDQIPHPLFDVDDNRWVTVTGIGPTGSLVMGGTEPILRLTIEGGLPARAVEVPAGRVMEVCRAESADLRAARRFDAVVDAANARDARASRAARG